MALGDICSNALAEIGGVEVPSTFFGNGNLTARQCVALVLRGGNSIVRVNRWTSLIKTYTFLTEDNIDNYALPDDFYAFANMSQWDRTSNIPMNGPTVSFIWQFLKSGIAQGATIDRWFRVQGGRLYMHPVQVPPSQTIAFDYYSKNWIVRQSDGVTARQFQSDNDTFLLDEDLLTLDLKWRFLQAKGFPFEAEYREFETTRDEILADDGGKGRINLGHKNVEWRNIPDHGYGRSSS